MKKQLEERLKKCEARLYKLKQLNAPKVLIENEKIQIGRIREDLKGINKENNKRLF